MNAKVVFDLSFDRFVKCTAQTRFTVPSRGKPYMQHAEHSGYYQLAPKMGREVVRNLPSETGPRIGEVRRYLNGWYRVEQALQEYGLAESRREDLQKRSRPGHLERETF